MRNSSALYQLFYNIYNFFFAFQSGQFTEDMIPTVGFNMRKITKGNVTIKVGVHGCINMECIIKRVIRICNETIESCFFSCDKGSPICFCSPAILLRSYSYTFLCYINMYYFMISMPGGTWYSFRLERS